ncbi:hypothetical protein PIB30_081338 [Stylosanthes scabra]|uniref:Uncharacterized protein n=1 Tax=Stylosanthes scabra TaxID=79078 RepID=A0ABU6QSD0_9FABA|nr:hypothetical protein [Stylosanthes scabra]
MDKFQTFKKTITYLTEEDANASGRFKRMTLKRKRPTKLNTCDVDDDDADSRKVDRPSTSSSQHRKKRGGMKNCYCISPHDVTLLEADDKVVNLDSFKKMFGGPMCSSFHEWCYNLDWSRKKWDVLDSMLRKKGERKRKKFDKLKDCLERRSWLISAVTPSKRDMFANILDRMYIDAKTCTIPVRVEDVSHVFGLSKVGKFIRPYESLDVKQRALLREVQKNDFQGEKATILSTCDVDVDDADNRKGVRLDNVQPSSPTMIEGGPISQDIDDIQ